MTTDLRRLAHLFVDDLFDRLDALGRDNATRAVFRSDGPLPLGTSRETFNRKASSIPGAQKVGGRGRGYWQVPRQAWFVAMRRRNVDASGAAESDEARARGFLEAAGYPGVGRREPGR